jgi:putative transport protein
MTWIADALREHPELAFFLTLAIGYAIGKIKIGSFKLGAVTGVLIAGVIIGQTGVKLSGDLKSVFFLLFLFSIGYKTGPQFFSGIRKSGLQQIGLTLLLCTVGLMVAYATARLFSLDAGTAAGLLAGGLTESAAVGTSEDQVEKLALSEAAKDDLKTNTAVAFAVTYFLGVILTVTFLSKIAPRCWAVILSRTASSWKKKWDSKKNRRERPRPIRSLLRVLTVCHRRLPVKL